MPKTAARRRNRQSISWATAPQQTLRSFIAMMTDNGNAVMFGRTMDGGALSLLVLSGNEKYREYITAPGEIVATLADLVEELLDSESAAIVQDSAE